ncbi:DUF2752 domain-containing protein [Nocardia brasiliensis]|uniref:DUF2752 domain-containing protein n=1 Tax=Nocardia brasiliensis TaxID=37326 RepID=UPI0018937429|nr:DUF2752 domain-containing protein [Nocardia brasiliensis]MBF6545846.1 DUF2752 domain-containing protein [Nocardia brasiliensis]
MESTHVAPEPAAHEGATHPSRSGWRGVGVPLLVAGVGVGLGALLHVRDPHVEGSYGVCPVYALTGYWCPGCGGMRAIHNLTDGNLLDSLHSNLLAIPLVLAFALWVGDWARQAWRGQKMRLPSINRVTMWTFFALLTAYTVLRNTPWGTWFTPV